MCLIWKEKEKDLTQSYSKSPYTNKNENKKESHNTKLQQKDRFHNYLRTLDGQAIGLTGLLAKTFNSQHELCNQTNIWLHNSKLNLEIPKF